MGGMRCLSADEVGAICGQIRGKFWVRNRALFLLGCNTGFRIHELLAIRLGDVVTEHGELVDEIYLPPERLKGGKGEVFVCPPLTEIVCEMSVENRIKLETFYNVVPKGKRRKVKGRTVELNAGSKGALVKLVGWLADCGFTHKDNFLFSRLNGRVICYEMALKVIKGAVLGARLKGKIGTHSMRKTFAANGLVAVDGDIRELKEMLGHSKLDSTAAYVETDADKRSKALQELSVGEGLM